MAHFDPRLKTFPSQRLTLHFAEWGPPQAPVILLVHGGRDHKRSWDWVARHLAARYRVIAHDLRGHGASDWVNDGDYGVMDHVFDLNSLFEHIGEKNILLIGHSLGGNIAIRFAGLYPDRIRKMVAIEGLGPSPKLLTARKAEPVETRLRAWIDQRSGLSGRAPRKMASRAEAEGRMRAAHPQLSADQVEHLTRHGTRENPDGSVSWSYDPAGMGRSPTDISPEAFQALWQAISAPVWLVYGAQSWASNPATDGRAAHFQNAQVTVFEGAGHWVQHDQLVPFLDGLDAFLAD